MTVATPHATYTARDGRVAVLWSHGRLTEHRRWGAKPARTIGRHVDSQEASDWAKKHGFEIIGLAGDVPRVMVAPFDDLDKLDAGGREMTSATKQRPTIEVEPPDPPLMQGKLPKGNAGKTESTRRSERVAHLIGLGFVASVAIDHVAAEAGIAPTAIMGAYYGWRKRRLAAGDEVPIPPRGHKLDLTRARVQPVHVTSSEPTTETPTGDRASVAPESTNGHDSSDVVRERVRAHAVSPIAGEEVDPLRQVEVSNREMARVLTDQWRGLIEARATLDRELEQTMEEMARIETEQERLQGAARALGIDLPERPSKP